MPSLSERRQNCVLYGAVTTSTVFPVDTFVVERFAIQHQVLSSNASAALRTRHQFTRAIRTIHLRVVVVVGSYQFHSAFGTHEVLLVIGLAGSSNEFRAIEATATLGTVRVATVLSSRWLYDGLSLVLFNITLSRRSSSVVCMVHRGGVRLNWSMVVACLVRIIVRRGILSMNCSGV